MRCNTGLRVRISPTAVLLLAVFALAAPVICLAAILAAAVCHELGHYAALRLCGGRLESLSVSAFGAQMRIRRRELLSYGRESLCVLAGPLVNVTLSWLLSVAGARWEELYIFAGAQLILGAFNLLPLSALDGGRLLWIGIAWLTDPFRADKVCRMVTLTVLLALTILGMLLWLRHRSGFLLVGVVGVVCCTAREFMLANRSDRG